MSGTRPMRGTRLAIAGLWLSVVVMFWGCGRESSSVSTQRPKTLEGYQAQVGIAAERSEILGPCLRP